MDTAFLEQQSGKPICVDRRNSMKQPYRAEAVQIEHKPPAEVLPRAHSPAEKPILTGKQRPAVKTPPAEPAAEAPAVRVKTGGSAVLWLAAVCGIAAGLVCAKNAGAGGGVLLCTEGSFLSLFLNRLLYGAAFLLAEYILGFFALGEWVVWLCPLCCGLGTGLSAAGLFGADYAGKALPLLIPAALTLGAVVSGARCSGEFSAQLLRVVSGNRTGIVLTGEAARGYSLRLLARLAAVAAASLLDAALKL